MNLTTSRRTMIKSSLALAAAATSVLHRGPRAAAAEDAGESAAVPRVILFQGDSITDAGRDRQRTGANDAVALGNGYPVLVAADLLRDHPGAGLEIFNRGISGNKVPDLASRWQEDCLALKPDLLSILIGVNDIWHKLNNKYSGTVEDYELGYTALLEQTQAALPQTRIVICEPFVLRTGAVTESWFPEFDQRREAAHRVAEKFKLTLVPFQSMFDKAVQDAEPSYWAGDGVHPSLAGHALMAKTWLEVVEI